VAINVKSRSLEATIELPTKEIITEGTTLDFSGLAIADGFEGPFSCSWTFGDGSGSDDCATSHTYTDDGTYTITFTVFDEDGHVAMDFTEVVVLNTKPTVKVAKNVQGVEGGQVYFTATATDLGDDELSFAWEMGDGTLVIGNDFFHTYLDSGKYVVTLVVTDDDGAMVVKLLTANIKNVGPKANAGNDKLGHVGEPVFFSGTVSDQGILDTFDIVWDMGDGKTIEGTLTPDYTYTSSGIYTVTLTVTDNDGEQSVSVLKVHVIETLDSVVNPPTSWKDTTTLIVIVEDKMVDEPIPLLAIALVVLNIIALAAGTYVWYISKKE
jgi:PKD repeat protein